MFAIPALLTNPVVRYALIAVAFTVAIGIQQLRINSYKADLKEAKADYALLAGKVKLQNEAIKRLATREKELRVEADKASAQAVQNLLFASNFAKGIKFKATTCEQAGVEAHETYAPVLIQKWRAK